MQKIYLYTISFIVLLFSFIFGIKESIKENKVKQEIFYVKHFKILKENSINEVIDTCKKEEHKKFLSQIIPIAIEIQKEKGIPASGIVAMSIYESYYGQSQLSRRHNNYFGMKALDKKWSGEKAYLRTRDGDRIHIQPFRVYSNLRDSVYGFYDFINYPRYKNVFKNNSSGEEFVKNIIKCGWCPDDDYFYHIKRIIIRHKLQILDEIKL